MVIGPQASASKPATMIGMIFDFIDSSLVENGLCFIKVPDFYAQGEKPENSRGKDSQGFKPESPFGIE